MNMRKVISRFATYLILAIIIIIMLLPLYFAFINSFKSYSDLMVSFLSVPGRITMDNYKIAWQQTDYVRTFLNTLFITIAGVMGVILFSAMASYKLARTKTNLSWFIYMFFICAMLIPFHAVMLPLAKVSAWFSLRGSIVGIIPIYWGLGVPFAIFLYHGFVKGVPKDIEEAGQIDGCGPFRNFFLVIFPLLKPITGTVLVLDVMWLWNDFLCPLIILGNKQNNRTLTLAQYSFFGEFTTEWNIALAALILGIIPCLIFFIFMQNILFVG